MNFDPSMVQKIQQLIATNPQLATLLQKPGMIQKLQQLTSNPNAMVQFMSDPDMQQIISLVQSGMGNNIENNNNMFNNNNFNMNNNNNNNNSNINNNNNSNSSNNAQPQQESIIHIHSLDQFNDLINNKKNSEKLIVCDFYATWCGPCKMIEGEYLRLSKYYLNKNTLFLKIDVDRNQSLAMSQKIRAMPTFQLYRGAKRVEEFQGADIRKLGTLLEKHTYVPPAITKASPYSFIPIHKNNLSVYSKSHFDKMVAKLQELNGKYDDYQKNKMTEKEFGELVSIIKLLQDQNQHYHPKFSVAFLNNVIMNKLLNQWKVDDLFVIIDFIRLLVLHPNFSYYLQDNGNNNNNNNNNKNDNKSDNNDNLIIALLKRCFNASNNNNNSNSNNTNYILACQVIINMFQRQITILYLIQHLDDIVNYLFNALYLNEKTRSAFVQILSHYAYNYYDYGIQQAMKQSQPSQQVQQQKEFTYYANDKLQILSLLTENLSVEKDANVLIKSLITLGTLLFRDVNTIDFAKSLDITMVIEHIKNRFDNNKEIVSCCEEILRCIEKPQD